MRPPRIRLTVRGMMLAVAILAVVLGVLIERRRRFRAIAGGYRSEQASHSSILISLGRNPAIAERDAWLRKMVAKYERAAGCPWLPVPPDPPDPWRSDPETFRTR
jgi:hypothetical protein